ncbi:MAG: phosphopantetheine-binding protein [Propionibacteriaceae bacterium]|jgi:acyl carrier protein|nr:phosphopantetheine-binding protein [Propionibacteriaceae bacterium]
MTSSQRQVAQDRFDLLVRLRSQLIEGLDLPENSDLVDFDTPLFGRGLDLDSLDTLEIVSLLDEEFSVMISDEDRAAFGSLNQLADRVQSGV